MKPDNGQKRAQTFLDDLVSQGRYHFDISNITTALGVSKASAYNSLLRLSKKGMIASPVKGFYVVVPPEYRSLGCLPAEQFIPALFERKGVIYYAALLTAAQYYGAAHQRPQTFQVMVSTRQRAIECGAVKVDFIQSKNIETTPVRQFNTPRGQLRVSSPEATALDLVGYVDRAGGLDQVATLLGELAEEIDAHALAELAKSAPLFWGQRLGYLLELVGHAKITNPLFEVITHRARDYAALAPGIASRKAQKDTRWKILVNTDVEPDL